jgi:hypothetical protein
MQFFIKKNQFLTTPYVLDYKAKVDDLRSCTNVNNRIFRGGGRVYRTCLQALKLLANPPLQTIENGARCEVDRKIYLRTDRKFGKEMLTYLRMESTFIASHQSFCLCRSLAQPSERIAHC